MANVATADEVGLRGLPGSLDRREPWRFEAACRGADLDLFFPTSGQPTTQAKAICAECPVRRECLAYALEEGLPGIWGGTAERERRRLG